MSKPTDEENQNHDRPNGFADSFTHDFRKIQLKQATSIQLLFDKNPQKPTGKNPFRKNPYQVKTHKYYLNFFNIILTFFHYYGSLILKFSLGFFMGVHFILRLT